MYFKPAISRSSLALRSSRICPRFRLQHAPTKIFLVCCVIYLKEKFACLKFAFVDHFPRFQFSGSICTVSCAPNQNSVGSNQFVCGSDGQWRGGCGFACTGESQLCKCKTQKKRSLKNSFFENTKISIPKTWMSMPQPRVCISTPRSLALWLKLGLTLRYVQDCVVF